MKPKVIGATVPTNQDTSKIGPAKYKSMDFDTVFAESTRPADIDPAAEDGGFDCVYLVTSFKDFKFTESSVMYASQRNILGYYLTLEEAEKAMRANSVSIHAGVYDYVVIEQVPEGLFVEALTHWLYKMCPDHDTYVKEADPAGLAPGYQFALG